MKFYTNKTKPKCNKWVKIIDIDFYIHDVIIVPENKRKLSSQEFFWSEWEDMTLFWQYEENFKKIFKKKMGVK